MKWTEVREATGAVTRTCTSSMKSAGSMARNLEVVDVIENMLFLFLKNSKEYLSQGSGCDRPTGIDRLNSRT